MRVSSPGKLLCTDGKIMVVQHQRFQIIFGVNSGRMADLYSHRDSRFIQEKKPPPQKNAATTASQQIIQTVRIN